MTAFARNILLKETNENLYLHGDLWMLCEICPALSRLVSEAKLPVGLGYCFLYGEFYCDKLPQLQDKTWNIIHHHYEKNMLSKGVMAAGAWMHRTKCYVTMFLSCTMLWRSKTCDFPYFSVIAHLTIKKKNWTVQNFRFYSIAKCSLLQQPVKLVLLFSFLSSPVFINDSATMFPTDNRVVILGRINSREEIRRLSGSYCLCRRTYRNETLYLPFIWAVD